jgi:hypothetical protein
VLSGDPFDFDAIFATQSQRTHRDGNESVFLCESFVASVALWQKSFLEKGQLVGDVGAFEVGGREGADVAVEVVFAGEDFEGLGDGVHVFAAAAAAVGDGVVEFAVAGVANEGFDFAGTVGVDIALQPVEEEFLELVGEAEENPVDAGGAGVGHGFEDRGEFSVGEAGDDGSDVDGDGDAGGDEFADGAQAAGGGGGAGLEFLGEVVVEGDEGDGDAAGVHGGEFLPEVDVAEDEGGFGHGDDGLAAVGEDLQALAGDLHFVFDGLVDVGDGGHDDGFGFPFGVGEFVLEEVGGVGFGHELGFEIEAGGEAEIFVVGSGEAVDAAVLAAAVGVEGPVEGDVGGGGDFVDDGVGFVEEDLALDFAGARFTFFLAFDHLAVEFFAEDVEAGFFEAVAGVEAGAAAVGGAVGEGVAV